MQWWQVLGLWFGSGVAFSMGLALGVWLKGIAESLRKKEDINLFKEMQRGNDLRLEAKLVFEEIAEEMVKIRRILDDEDLNAGEEFLG